MYRWRHIRLDFTQVATNKSPVSPEPRLLAHAAPLVHRARDRHRRARARARPGRGAQAELRARRGDAVRDAERLRLRLRRLRGHARRRARPDRLRRGSRSGARRRPRGDGCSASGSARRSTRARTTSASPGSINPDLQFSGNNEVATVKLDIFGEIVVTLGTTPQGQGHETTAAQVVADILEVLRRRRARARRPRQLLELARRLLRHLREPVRGHRPRRGQGRDGDARRPRS